MSTNTSTTRQHRPLRSNAVLDPADEVREVERNGRTYLVFPLIAAREMVLDYPENGTKEYLPADRLRESVEWWAGTPLTFVHPENRQKTADDPTVYVENNIGEGHDPEIVGEHDDKLRVMAWVDVQKALDLGGLAEKVVAKLRNGEELSVSAGYATLDDDFSGGAFEGESYDVAQGHIIPDHIAIFPSDEFRARCAPEDGCAAPRANAVLGAEHTTGTGTGSCASCADDACSPGPCSCGRHRGDAADSGPDPDDAESVMTTNEITDEQAATLGRRILNALGIGSDADADADADAMGPETDTASPDQPDTPSAGQAGDDPSDTSPTTGSDAGPDATRESEESSPDASHSASPEADASEASDDEDGATGAGAETDDVDGADIAPAPGDDEAPSTDDVSEPAVEASAGEESTAEDAADDSDSSTDQSPEESGDDGDPQHMADNSDLKVLTIEQMAAKSAFGVETLKEWDAGQLKALEATILENNPDLKMEAEKQQQQQQQESNDSQQQPDQQAQQSADAKPKQNDEQMKENSPDDQSQSDLRQEVEELKAMVEDVANQKQNAEEQRKARVVANAVGALSEDDVLALPDERREELYDDHKDQAPRQNYAAVPGTHQRDVERTTNTTPDDADEYPAGGRSNYEARKNGGDD